jgi:hypothetical protein
MTVTSHAARNPRVATTVFIAALVAVAGWSAAEVTALKTCTAEGAAEPPVYFYSPSRHVCQEGIQAGDLAVYLPVVLGPLALLGGSVLRARRRGSGFVLYAVAAVAPFLAVPIQEGLPDYVIGERGVFYDGRLLRLGPTARPQLCFAYGPQRSAGNRLLTPGGPPQLCVLLRRTPQTASLERDCAMGGGGGIDAEVGHRLSMAGLHEARQGEVSLDGLSRPIAADGVRWMPEPGALLPAARPQLAFGGAGPPPRLRALVADLRRRDVPHTVWPRAVPDPAFGDTLTAAIVPISLPGDAVRLRVARDGRVYGLEHSEGHC